MNIDRYLELEAGIKQIIGDSFTNAFKKRPADFVLLMSRGGYHKHLDKPELDYTPFVLEDGEDRLMDLTRKRFFMRYLDRYVERLKNSNTINGDDLVYEINIQLMIYSHIWESHLFLNQLARLAGIQNGTPYLWITKLPQDSKKNFINQKIIDVFKKTDEYMYLLIKHCYSDKLRNTFAHSSYYIAAERIHLNINGLFSGPSISFEQWEEVFVESVLLSYHLNNMLLEEKNHYIEKYGDASIVIDLPMKNNHKERRGVYIKPEHYDGEEEKVKFRYVQNGEI